MVGARVRATSVMTMVLAVFIATVGLVAPPPAAAATVWRAELVSSADGKLASLDRIDGDWAVGYVGGPDGHAYPGAYNVVTREWRKISDRRIHGLAPVVISGTTVAATVVDADGRAQPLTYDLETGRTRELKTLGWAAYITAISDETIAGVRRDPNDEEGFVHDLTTGQTVSIPVVPFRGASLPTAADGDIIVGQTSFWHAFSYTTRTGTTTDLGSMPWDPTSRAQGIEGTTVVGTSYEDGFWGHRDAFVTSATGGQPQHVPGLSATSATATGISSKWIVGAEQPGTRAYVSERATGTLTWLPAPPGATGVAPTDVDGDVIIGEARTPDGFVPVVWRAAAAVDGSTPRVTGTARVGSTLTAWSGTWGPGTVTLTYQWYRDGRAITGATGRTRTLTSYDRGARLRVKVTGRRSGLVATSKTSASTAAIAAGVMRAPTPTIGGTRKVGSKLTVYRGSWSPSGVTLRQQWYRGGHRIAGATGTTYTLTQYDRSAQLTVKVTGTKTGYTTTTKTSAATTRVS